MTEVVKKKVQRDEHKRTTRLYVPLSVDTLSTCLVNR